MKLLRTSDLVLTRYGASEGYYNAQNIWVDGTTTEAIPIQGSLQPFSKGNNSVELPEGVRGDASVFLYTKTRLKSQDDVKGTTADTILIDDDVYECFYVEDWTRYNLKAIHYKAVFIRKDKL